MSRRVDVFGPPLGESDWVRAREDEEQIPKPPERETVIVGDKSFDEPETP